MYPFGDPGRALVTGAAGFVGASLIRRLLRDGVPVAAIARRQADPWRLAEVIDEIDLIVADISEVAPAEALNLRGVEIVYHLAAGGVAPGLRDERQLVHANVLGTLNVLELARKLGARRLVYAGSCFEYGKGEGMVETAPLRPLTFYGATKCAAGHLALAFSLEHALEVVWLRPFTVYGPYESPHRLIPSVILAALSGKPVALSSGEQRRDLVYVNDAVDAFVAAAREPRAAGETLNVCSGSAIAVRDVARAAAQRAGGAELRLGALPLRQTDAAVLSGDPTRAEKILGWRTTTDLDEGLRRTVEWFAENSSPTTGTERVR